MRRLVPVLIASFSLALPTSASASCMCMMRPPPTETGLADEETKNPATSVFLLRDGTRTILTIEAAYEGPDGELSMLVPLPHAIEREHVRTISGTHFRRIDQRTAPRARHTFPSCGNRMLRRRAGFMRGRVGAGMAGAGGAPDDTVEVLEEWDVDEYDVTLLSAGESTGLLRFLGERGLALPDGAEPILRAYIESDHRFALIQLDPAEAHVVGGQRVLSPIQLEYQSDELRVPVRLGTLNSPGEQELLLYVLSRDGRYELANRENVIAPTGARLRPDYEGGFGPFYQGLMEQVFEQHPGAAVTEYAKRLGSGGASARDVWWLGLDRYRTDPSQWSAISWRDTQRWTLTRIRHRYGRALDDDLVLRPASELRVPSGPSWPRTGSNFQVRFTVEHPAGVCPSWPRRQGLAREWAGTSDALWAAGSAWPGDALVDPLIGIEPGSSAPVRAETDPAVEPEREIAREARGTPAVEPPAPSSGGTPAAAVASSGCSVSPTGPAGPAWLLGTAVLLLRRRRRAGTTRLSTT